MLEMPYADIEKQRASSLAYKKRNADKVKVWDKKYNEEHPDKRKAIYIRYREKHKAEILAKWKATRDARAAAGDCISCGGPRDSIKKNCSRCLTKYKAWARKKQAAKSVRDRSQYLARKAAGLCVESGCGLPAVDGQTRCTKHRDAQNKRMKEFFKRHPDHKIKIWLKHRYGLTPEDRAAKLTAQGGRCAICLTDKPGGRGWNIDHCHATNRVRDLLCNGCNHGLGNFKDNPDLLRAAADYIERHRLRVVG